MRLSPLNIVLACILVWAISEMGEEGKSLFSWWLLVVLIIVITIVDILFRVWTKDNQRLWMLQIAFILVVGIGSVIIKIL